MLPNDISIHSSHTVVVLYMSIYVQSQWEIGTPSLSAKEAREYMCLERAISAGHSPLGMITVYYST